MVAALFFVSGIDAPRGLYKPTRRPNECPEEILKIKSLFLYENLHVQKFSEKTKRAYN